MKAKDRKQSIKGKVIESSSKSETDIEISEIDSDLEISDNILVQNLIMIRWVR